MGWFGRLRAGLQKTASALVNRIETTFRSFRSINEELFEALEEILIQGDVGVETSLELVDHLRRTARERKLERPEDLMAVLREKIADLLGQPQDLTLNPTGLTVVLVVGVNGAGKTTTVAKLAHRLRSQGQRVILAAADTFRAAAIEQLATWGQRVGCDVIHQSEGSDPAAVAFDALQAARSRKADVLLVDTAGRLHTKANLMDELAKVGRVLGRELPGAPHEVLLVLDATTGQNALQQARLFGAAAGVTGVVLTKLDGTAKGGVVVAIRRAQAVPVKFIGVGEQMDDLQPFDPEAFAAALFGDAEGPGATGT